MSDNIIQINNMNKWFGDFQVLKGINLEVKPKQKIVVCGPSGSGKSTLIRCINRLEEHQDGQIIVDGNEISENTKDLEKMRAEVVSFSDELLILVDSDDQEIGYLDKESCHNGDGKLHRAFSVFIFNSDGKLLLQQRKSSKRLWGGYWANTCCSHPRKGETVDGASQRRLLEEVGLVSKLKWLFKFEYSDNWRRGFPRRKSVY